MDKIKREFSYRTTDGKLHSGKNAAKKAKEHQRIVDFGKTIKNIIPVTEDLFNLKDVHDESDGNTDETILIDKINECLFCKFDNLEDLIYGFVDLQIDIPEFADFLVFIKNQLEKFK